VSACAPGQGQVVHENPGTVVPSRSQPVDDQMASLLERMLADLDGISAAVEAGNFSEARASYSTFYSSFTKYNDLMWQLNLSESDYRAIAEQVNLTNDQVRSIIDEAEVYRVNSMQYEQALSGGDRENASSYAARARESYANVSSSYGGLKYNASLLGSVLQDSGVDTGRLDSSMGSLDRLMVEYNKTYRNLSTAVNGTMLTLSANRSNLSVGDAVTLRALLKNSSGTPVYGERVTIYVDGDPAGSFLTDAVGEASAEYVVPASVSGDHVLAHAEYLPAAAPIAVSNHVDLYIRDLPVSLTMELDANTAYFGDKVNIAGNLTAGGQPMPYRAVNISLNGLAIATVRTGKDGSYSHALAVGASTPAEIFILNASYCRKPGDLLLNGTSPDRTLGIIARATRMTMDVPGALSPGGVSGFTGSLTTEHGLPVGEANVSVYIDGAEAGNGATGADGSYRVMATVSPDAAPGDHSIYAAFKPEPGMALTGSSSDPVAVPIIDSGQKLEALGAPLVAFPGDRLDLSWSLRTGNGMPIPDKALTLNSLGTGETTIMTGPQGEFNQSYTVTGSEPAGMYPISIVDPDTGKTLYEASVLFIPVDRSVLLGALALAIVAVAAAFLLYRRYAGRKPEIAAGAVEAPAITLPEEPVVVQGPEKAAFDAEGELALIRSSMEGPGMQAAATQAYVALRKLLVAAGLDIDDSMTHNEVYVATAATFPAISRPSKYIVKLYEKAVFAGREPSAEELEQAINGLREADALLKLPEDAR